MSVESACSMFKGWELDEKDFTDKTAEFIELLDDHGHLHWVDYYNDSYPRILGVKSNVSIEEGAIHTAEDFLETFPEGEEEALRKIAKEFFGIETPPRLLLALCVY